VAEREAPGDFDYLWDDPADVDGLTSHDQDFEAQQAEELDHPPSDPGADLWDEPDDNFWDNQPDVRDVGDTGHVDAFNVTTWSFKPAPPPWYRTKQALTALIAASAAVAAIVVSGVLLVFRGQGGEIVNEVTSSATPTAPTSAAPVPLASSEAPSSPSSPAPPPPPPGPPLPPPPGPPLPPPPPESAASPVNPAPRYNPTYEPRPTKPPEIGVTRTPVTRLPISVAPQPRTGLR
jgi:hypothetical protein